MITYSNEERGYVTAYSGPGERPAGNWDFYYNLGYGNFKWRRRIVRDAAAASG